MTIYEIIDALNECAAEIEDAGDWIIDCVIDMREEDGLPPFTPEELKRAEAECDKNAEKVSAIEEKMDALREDYFGLTGKYPHYYEATNRYGVNFSWGCDT